MQNNPKKLEIDLKRVAYLIGKHRKMLLILSILSVILGTLFMGIDYLRRRETPMHIITSSFAVVAKDSTGGYGSNVDGPDYNDVKLAKDIVSSVIFVAKSDRVLTAAVEKGQFLSIDISEIRKNLTVQQHEDSQVVILTLNWVNGTEGLNIVKAICDVLPDILIETLDLGSVSVIDYPKDTGLTKTRVRWTFIAIFFLAIIGAYLAFIILQDILHPTLNDLNKVEIDLDGVENLGIIPDDEEYFLEKPYKLTTEIDPKYFQVQEALISTSHVLMHMSEHEQHKCYYITSSVSGEGKTGILANLAIGIAGRDKKVLAIDMDVRKPSLASCFLESVDHEHSLNAIYDGTVSPEDAIIHLSDTLDILPARLEPEPIRIDNVLRSQIRTLFDKYDMVLLDAPPIGMVSDTMDLNRLADRAIYVIKFDAIWTETIKKNINKLKKSGIKTCGTIMTQTDYSFGSGRDYFYHSYHTYYAKKPVKKAKPPKKFSIKKLFRKKKQ